MQQTWYVDFAGDLFFDENFRSRLVKTFIIQRSIRNFHTFPRISMGILERWFAYGPPRYYFEAISDMEPRPFSWPKLAKKHPHCLFISKLFFILSTSYEITFFLLTASGQNLFRKKTLQTAHGRSKISQMRRLTFYLTSLRYSDRCVI